MEAKEVTFAIDDKVDWQERLPWHKEDGPFIVIKVYNNHPLACTCGRNGDHRRGELCRSLPRQLVVVKTIRDNWVLLDHTNGSPAKIASRFFRAVVS